MSEELIRNKTADAGKKSNALAYYWQKPITYEQLQEEMKRMAKQTRQPGVLKELWASLNNDPFLIAECFVRPILADRLIRSWFAHDIRFHGELRKQAINELKKYQSADQMKRLSGTYSEVVWLKEQERTREQNEMQNIRLNEDEWKQNELPLRKISSLKEDEDRFYAIALLEKSPNRIKAANVAWRKVSFEQWWKKIRNVFSFEVEGYYYHYNLPSIAENSCVADTWFPIEIEGRSGHTAIWTGTEMIIWGGRDDIAFFQTGARYQPGIDSWIPTSLTNAPSSRSFHSAVWTGTAMLIWGGYDGNDYLNTGAIYNPDNDSWTTIPGTDAPQGRAEQTAIWTGSEMVVWGGDIGTGGVLNTGGKYNPDVNTWTATSLANVPEGRTLHSAVWTGSEMIVWGGENASNYFNSGGKYNPDSDSWIPTATTNAPPGTCAGTCVWTGTDMIVWGGSGSNGRLNSGGKYNPAADSWTATSKINVPSGRAWHNAVWTGLEMIVWGGQSGYQYFNTGG